MRHTYKDVEGEIALGLTSVVFCSKGKPTFLSVWDRTVWPVTMLVGEALPWSIYAGLSVASKKVLRLCHLSTNLTNNSKKVLFMLAFYC